MVRAFAGDAPPAKLAFYHAAAGRGAGSRTAALPRLADLLRLNDAGQKALLDDWLRRLSTPPTTSTTRWPRASKLHARRSRSDVQSGHAVTRAQRELLRAGLRAGRPAGAPAGDREPREAVARAGADRRGSARRRWCAPRRRTRDASQRLAVGAPRSRRDAEPRARAAGRDAAPDAAGRADRARAASRSPATWPRSTRSSRNCRSAASTAEARFEELDMQLADSQERHAAARRARDRGRAQAGRSARAAAQPRAPGAGSAVRAARAGSAPRRAAARHRDGDAAGARHRRRQTSARRPSSARLTDAAAQAGLQNALALKLRARAGAGRQAQRVRRPHRQAARQPTSAACSSSASSQPLRERITELQLKEQAARLGLRAVHRSCWPTRRPTSRPSRKSIEDGNVQACRACRARSTASTARSPRSARSTWPRSTSWPRRASARASSTRRPPT